MPVTEAESFKLLYGVLKLSDAKASWATIGTFMGLKPGTAEARYRSLMAKLEKDHGEVVAEGASTTVYGNRAQKGNMGNKKQNEADGENGNFGTGDDFEETPKRKKSKKSNAPMRRFKSEASELEDASEAKESKVVKCEEERSGTRRQAASTELDEHLGISGSRQKS